MPVQTLGRRNRRISEDKFAGMVSNISPRVLADGFSPWCRNVEVRDGVIFQRFGKKGLGTKQLNDGEEVLGLFNWDELDGTHHLIACTDTDIWEWSDGNEEWNEEPLTPQTEVEDCEDAWVAKTNVTCTADATVFKKGTYSAKQVVGASFYQEVDDCEDAWTAKTNVTSTADTVDYQEGAASAKHVIAAAFTTGLISTWDFGAIDLSGYNRLVFWIKSDLALDAGDLQIILSETAVCGAEDIAANIPALVAGTWTHVNLTVDMTGLAAVISVGLKAVNDPGEATLHIDHVCMLATQGLIATEEYTADLSGDSAVGFWIRSDATLPSGTLQLILTETAVCAVEDLAVDIPALTADTWTYVYSEEDLSALNAAVSVGLKALTVPLTSAGVIIGEHAVYIDDVRTFNQLGGGLDDHFTGCWMNDAFVLTNGTTDGVLTWDGATRGFVLLAGYDGYNGAQTYHQFKIVLEVRGHILGINTTEDSTQYKRRIRWSTVATLETWASANYLDVYGSEEEIIGAAKRGDYIPLLTENSLAVARYIGGEAIFGETPEVRVRGDCCRALRSVQAHEIGVFYMGLQNVYMYDGSRLPAPIGDPIKDILFAELNHQRRGRAFGYIDRARHCYRLFIPTGENLTPDAMWSYDFINRTWTAGDVDATCAGDYRQVGGLTWDDMPDDWDDTGGAWVDYAPTEGGPTRLLGVSTGYVYVAADSAPDDDGTAISSEWQTRDFDAGTDEDKRYQRLTFEGLGAEGTVAHSIDGGFTWQQEETISMNAGLWGTYNYWPEAVGQTIRYRFRNTTASQRFGIRRLTVQYKQYGGRVVE